MCFFTRAINYSVQYLIMAGESIHQLLTATLGAAVIVSYCKRPGVLQRRTD